MHFLQYLAAVPLLLTPLSSALPTPSSEVTESPALTSYLRSVEARQALSTTENGLSDACKPVTFIFARGTNEDGNVGTIAGPPLFAALRSSLGAAAINFQGVTYAANVFGYLVGGDPAGSTEMLRLINLAATQCPSTKLVLGGYSQGAQLVHKAAEKLTAAVTARVAAVVVFGDPYNNKAVGTIPTAKVKSICHAQDIVCTGLGGYTTHLTYGNDAATAAAFVVSKV